MNNYLEELDVETKKVFITALSYIAHADGNFDEDEKEFIEAVCEINELSDDFEEIAKNHSDEEIIDLIKKADFEEKLKLALIRDMFTLANSDGDLSDDEVISIANVGEALDIPLETLEEISEWVAEGIDWRLRGEDIFGDFF